MMYLPNLFKATMQYRRTDGLVGTGLMPYKAHSPKYQHFMLFPYPMVPFPMTLSDS